ncbi:HTH-type transcriptional regulator / antitoxin MqsA [uncultured Gammaproteobacteria bacterium]
MAPMTDRPVFVDFCPECGQQAVAEMVAQVTHRVGQREVIVERDRHLRCGHCGNISYRGDMLDENQHAIAAILRKQDNLLTPDELRSVRLKYGFTQAEMEKLLTIGPKTWVRWERGKVVQGLAADQMIRQIAKNPELLRDLMTNSDIRNEAAEQVLVSFDETVERRIAEMLRQRLPEVASEKLQDVARVVATEVRQSQHGYGHKDARMVA